MRASSITLQQRKVWQHFWPQQQKKIVSSNIVIVPPKIRGDRQNRRWTIKLACMVYANLNIEARLCNGIFINFKKKKKKKKRKKTKTSKTRRRRRARHSWSELRQRDKDRKKKIILFYIFATKRERERERERESLWNFIMRLRMFMHLRRYASVIAKYPKGNKIDFYSGSISIRWCLRERTWNCINIRGWFESRNTTKEDSRVMNKIRSLTHTHDA